MFEETRAAGKAIEKAEDTSKAKTLSVAMPAPEDKHKKTLTIKTSPPDDSDSSDSEIMDEEFDIQDPTGPDSQSGATAMESDEHGMETYLLQNQIDIENKRKEARWAQVKNDVPSSSSSKDSDPPVPNDGYESSQSSRKDSDSISSGNEEKETPSFFQKFWKALKESEPRMWPKRLMDLLTKSFVRKTPVKLYSESEEKDGLSETPLLNKNGIKVNNVEDIGGIQNSKSNTPSKHFVDWVTKRFQMDRTEKNHTGIEEARISKEANKKKKKCFCPNFVRKLCYRVRRRFGLLPEEGKTTKNMDEDKNPFLSKEHVD
ncbi:hypothetical protein PCANC_19772 [Puccinia coronata f. sp. avenae]|uniref:Uncharacterized protein n=2 Tax=Puccinia coronata f. sp. avenae TaxID=200324 RepID=A0A2N5UB74_9BASI|nr:hypothetical protein PCANC_19772 [Puccinia coronata f. sp. avenae]